jgi:hypothetical protein
MTPESPEQWQHTMKSAPQCSLLDRARMLSELIADMHLQIIDAGEGLSRRYVASGPHCWARKEEAALRSEPNKRMEC